MDERFSIAALRELHERATPGPWSWTQHERGPWQVGTCCDQDDELLHGYVEIADVVPIDLIAEGSGPQADPALIVAMRNALPWLLELVEAAEVAMNEAWPNPNEYHYADYVNHFKRSLARFDFGDKP